jgi:hypothetical protein
MSRLVQDVRMYSRAAHPRVAFFERLGFGIWRPAVDFVEAISESGRELELMSYD